MIEDWGEESPSCTAAAYLKCEERRVELSDDVRCDDVETQKRPKESGGATARCLCRERLEAGPLELRGTEIWGIPISELATCFKLG